MGKVEILDCTLRDGAYIVDSMFGDGAIRGIIGKLQKANIDLIECGWLKNDERKEGSSFFHVPSDIDPFLKNKKSGCTYVAMIDWNRYDDSILPENDGSSIDAVRIVFPYGKAKEGMEIGDRISKKGYKVYFQAANTLAYNEEDLKELAKLANIHRPEGLSIVDTFGAMYEEDLLNIAKVLDNELDETVKLGFHSHNNQQMAFANSMAFANFFAKGTRDIIVDASLCGMGRGAGNATTELIAGFLNRKHSGNYNMDEILDAIDTFMVGFQENYKWGYSTPYFIAGTYCCHVNNIAFLLDNHRASAKDMRHVIASLSEEQRLQYDYDLLEEKYIENQSRQVDDEEEFDNLSNCIKGRKVLLVAPGISSLEETEKIKAYAKKSNATVIAVNAILNGYDYDYILFSNKVRYDYAKSTYEKQFAKTQKLVLSNVKTRPCENETIINFNRAIKRGWEHFDNAVMCALRLLEKLGVDDVAIAGFDGFKKKYNESYADKSLPTLIPGIDYDELNEEIRDMYQDFVKSCGEKMTIEFVTESYFA